LKCADFASAIKGKNILVMMETEVGFRLRSLKEYTPTQFTIGESRHAMAIEAGLLHLMTTRMLKGFPGRLPYRNRSRAVAESRCSPFG
jgi:hypothetical protein